MDYRLTLKSLGCAAISVVGAGLFYICWLAVFIPAFKTGIVGLQIVGWLSAPLVTGLGFATGLWIGERVLRTRASGFLHVLVWPLVGCSIGAAAVFAFGPMLIVFGMFAAGAASVVFREGLLMCWGGARKD